MNTSKYPRSQKMVKSPTISTKKIAQKIHVNQELIHRYNKCYITFTDTFSFVFMFRLTCKPASYVHTHIVIRQRMRVNMHVDA